MITIKTVKMKHETDADLIRYIASNYDMSQYNTTDDETLHLIMKRSGYDKSEYEIVLVTFKIEVSK